MADLRIPGVDVSKWQPDVDWAKIIAAGMQFAFVRASNGTGAANEQMFVPHWRAAKAAGMAVRGAYHYFEPGQSAADQAALFLSQVRSALTAGESAYLPAVLDVEAPPNGVAAAAYVAGITAWLGAVEADPLFAGRKSIVYTTQSFWAELGNPAGFSSRPLWIADYSQDPPRLPSGWSTYAFFQKSQTGSVSGIPGNADLDFFNGDIDVLTAMTAPLTA